MAFTALVASLLVASVASVASASESTYENVARGAFIDGSFSTSAAGDAIMGELGGEYAGIRFSRDLRTVMQWDVLVALKSGVLGNEHPYLFLIGTRALAFVEGGFLLRHKQDSAFNGYIGARVSGALQILANPDVGRFDEINAADGTGGSDARAAFRVNVGSAWVHRPTSFFSTLFFQEELQAPTTNFPSYAFSELGVALRFDIEKSVMATLEGLVGFSQTHTNALGGSDQTTRIGASGSFRKFFAHGMWIGLSVSIERDSDQVSYGGASAFDTADAPALSAMLSYGLPLSIFDRRR